MVYIGSVGIGMPKNNMEQAKVKAFIEKNITYKHDQLRRFLPVFQHSNINERQFVLPMKWYEQNHTFEETNEAYVKHAIKLSVEAMDDCLQRDFLLEEIDYAAIDLLIFVSSTGISTPSIDAYLINERPFREDVERMPLWGLGCGGGAIGLSRARDYLEAHPTKTVLVVCCELCSLTFQKDDLSVKNLVGTALFGDGVAATLLVGKNSPYRKYIVHLPLRIEQTRSFLQKGSLTLMGWKVTNHGFEVIFSKRIPKMIKTLWSKHVENFLNEQQLTMDEIAVVLAHPGGRKVLEEMEGVIKSSTKLSHSYDVLRNHGNMSSATVFYVLLNF